MKSRHILVASELALALSACGQSPAPAPAPAETPAETPAEAPAAPADAMPASEPAPVETAPAQAASGNKPAVVADCATTIEGSDAMQYNVDSITVPSSCTQFTINLKHVGTMPITAMGHNVVVSKESDMAGIAADGMGVSPEHVKDGDTRVIAHTKMLGGGESASVSFDVAKIRDGGPYVFFCSFPGHLALMKGSIQVQ